MAVTVSSYLIQLDWLRECVWVEGKGMRERRREAVNPV